MGELTAIIASTGAPQWTVPIPSKAAIRTAPAVDPAGNIIVGANDGNVYLFTSAGILSKTVALSGVPTSAAPANGHVYLASGNGTVYDFADSLATVVWSKSLPATTHSAPSVDTAANLLIIGDDGGNVTALNAATGAQVWQIHTGGAVTAQAAIQSGTVWIGSGDGTLYVLRETTGAVIWKAAADSAIVAGASVNGIGTVTFGTANGTLYQYTPTGQQVFAQPTVYGNTAIVGVSSITNNFFVETAGGIVAATRLDAGAPQFPFFEFSAGSPLMTAPTILDSAVYIAAGNGKLYAFTPYGKNPVPAAVHRAGPVITVTDGQWSCTPQ
jgi:outer membrane protein assembly factor BamB